MSDMIDQVAKGIFAERFCGNPPTRGFTSDADSEWASLSEEIRDLWRIYACAALKAAREPTTEMILACADLEGSQQAIWQRSIDAALQPEHV